MAPKSRNVGAHGICGEAVPGARAGGRGVRPADVRSRVCPSVVHQESILCQHLVSPPCHPSQPAVSRANSVTSRILPTLSLSFVSLSPFTCPGSLPSPQNHDTRPGPGRAALSAHLRWVWHQLETPRLLNTVPLDSGPLAPSHTPAPPTVLSRGRRHTQGGQRAAALATEAGQAETFQLSRDKRQDSGGHHLRTE